MGNERRKRIIAAIFGWGVSLVFLAMALSSIDLTVFWQSLIQVSLLDLLLLFAIYGAGFFVRGLRSQVLLPNLSFTQAVGGVFVGYAANNLLPARLGEFVRAQVVGRGTQMSRTTVLSSIFVERVFDGFAIVTILLLCVGGETFPTWVDTLKWSGLTLFGSLLIVIIAARKIEARLLSRLNHTFARELAEKFLVGFSLATRNVSTLARVLLYSFGTWVVEGLMFVYALHAFNIEIPFWAGFFALGVVNLGVLIPSSPGNLGVFQYFTIISLRIFGVHDSTALAYAVVIHGCQYLPTTFIGIGFLRYFGFKSLLEVRGSSSEG